MQDEIPRNLNLKFEIIKKFRNQRNFAAKVRKPEGQVSEVIHGRRNISEKEQARWARALKVPVNKIF